MEKKPALTGTFVQFWKFRAYTEEDWVRHLEALLEVGIDTVIVQNSALTPGGAFRAVCYPSALAEAGARTEDYQDLTHCLVRLFAAAERVGVKLFLGLNDSPEWWDQAFRTEAWFALQGRLGVQIAGELYRTFYDRYPAQFVGWYFPWEFYNYMGPERQALAAGLMQQTLAALSALDPSLPLLLSPFVNEKVTPAETEAFWRAFFPRLGLRPGDIFCCQDAVGAGYMSPERAADYFAAMRRAADTVPGLRFWANNEDFVLTPAVGPMPLDRFLAQLDATAPYVENHVTFAYSHYYHPDLFPAMHAQYKAALAQRGQLPGQA